MKWNVAILPGDGIGKEVMDVSLPILEDLKVPLTLTLGEIGWECWKKDGDPIPPRTWDLIEKSDAILLGAITSKPLRQAEAELNPSLKGKGLKYISPIIQLRQCLHLFANVRPTSGMTKDGRAFRFSVIRENTEGLYCGLDYTSQSFFARETLNAMMKAGNREELSGDFAYSIRLTTRQGLERLFHFAFDHARAEKFENVTLADKPNVLRESGQFVMDVFESVGAQFPEIHREVQNADAVALGMIRRPEQFGVVVAENMFGDILSDVAAGVMGGLGLAPSANVGSLKPYFEPVHGSAPKYTGKNKANPMAMFLSIALLLRYFKFNVEAEKIEKAVAQVLIERKICTADLGGSATTQEMAQAIRSKVQNGIHKTCRAAVLATGAELISGDCLNTTSCEVAEKLEEAGWNVTEHRIVGDTEIAIKDAVESLSAQNELLVVTGGLGPTSDDRTRFALASALRRDLEFDEKSWKRIVHRLTGFGIVPLENNRQQALFPTGAEILENKNGTASGCSIQLSDSKRIVLLPGPPDECLPILDSFLSGSVKKESQWKKALLLGATEGEVAMALDQLAEGKETGYRWSYPYIEVKIKEPTPQQWSKIQDFIKPWVIGGDYRKPASLQLQNRLEEEKIFISDSATGGLFLSTLISPRVRPLTSTESENFIRVEVTGLEEYWDGEHGGNTEVKVGVQVSTRSPMHYKSLRFPLRGPEVRVAAVEFACDCILKELSRD